MNIKLLEKLSELNSLLADIKGLSEFIKNDTFENASAVSIESKCTICAILCDRADKALRTFEEMELLI